MSVQVHLRANAVHPPTRWSIDSSFSLHILHRSLSTASLRILLRYARIGITWSWIAAMKLSVSVNKFSVRSHAWKAAVSPLSSLMVLIHQPCKGFLLHWSFNSCTVGMFPSGLCPAFAICSGIAFRSAFTIALCRELVLAFSLKKFRRFCTCVECLVRMPGMPRPPWLLGTPR